MSEPGSPPNDQRACSHFPYVPTPGFHPDGTPDYVLCRLLYGDNEELYNPPCNPTLEKPDRLKKSPAERKAGGAGEAEEKAGEAAAAEKKVGGVEKEVPGPEEIVGGEEVGGELTGEDLAAARILAGLCGGS